MVQELLDYGHTPNNIAVQLGVHHMLVQRVIKSNSIEHYVAFDENNSEPIQKGYNDWDYEDELDKWATAALQGRRVVLPQSKGISDLFTLGIYKHIEEAYGGFEGWVRKRCSSERGYFYKQCFKCRKIKSVVYFRKRSSSLSGICPRCLDCYDNARDKDAMRSAANNRRAVVLSLPSVWGMQHRRATLPVFERCILRKAADYADDHFIPLSIGHGGTYVGNMSPLERSLNSSKSDTNPFEWFEANRQRFDLEQSAFDALVVKLAQQNGLTSEEFRSFTYWCFANQRSIDEVHADNERYGYKRPSLEIWREAIGLPFPIRVDFGDLSLDHAVAA